MIKNLKDIGEFGLINRIRNISGDVLDGGITGIGDDAAVIPVSQEWVQLITCDTLVENIHFRRDFIKPEQLGYKCLAVNLSDVAAMGGIPKYLFLSLAIPEIVRVDWLDAFMEGFTELARESGAQLLGGDTTRTEKTIMISCTVIGEAHAGSVKKRGDAKTGDHLLVSGKLGDSGAGLHLLMNEVNWDDANNHTLIKVHNCPYPFVREGSWLGQQADVHAMMDVSDGLASDAAHIAESSGKTVTIELEKLPLSAALLQAAGKLGFDAMETALSAGEDYVLLVSAGADSVASLQTAYEQKFGSPLTDIGFIREGEPGVHFIRNGEEQYFKGGFDHFKS